jgi:Zn finger protein HypA/HybF involved in hydrogenase expression
VATHTSSRHIDDLVVQVGVLSGVNRDSLEFCLGEAAGLLGLVVDRFSVEQAPARAECRCGHTYEVEDPLQPCPMCGGHSRSFVGGADVVVKRLVVVEENEPKETGPQRNNH